MFIGIPLNEELSSSPHVRLSSLVKLNPLPRSYFHSPFTRGKQKTEVPFPVRPAFRLDQLRERWPRYAVEIG